MPVAYSMKYKTLTSTLKARMPASQHRNAGFKGNFHVNPRFPHTDVENNLGLRWKSAVAAGDATER